VICKNAFEHYISNVRTEVQKFWIEPSLPNLTQLLLSLVHYDVCKFYLFNTVRWAVGHCSFTQFTVFILLFDKSSIQKCFVSKDCDSLLRAYITYVCPLLEYASQAWSSHLVTDINKLEAVQTQRRFTKRLNGMESMDYPSRLKALAIDRL